MIMTIVLSSVLLTLLVFDVLIRWLWPGRLKSQPAPLMERPVVTVLIAVRNEEREIPGLIKNLRQLDYPPDKIQVIFGEDRSEDGTRALLKESLADHPNFKLVTITEDLPDLRGKANVIAQLIPAAQSEYLFITDADVRVARNWIGALLPFAHEKTGALGGCTVVAGEDLWSQWQNMDWLLAQTMLFTADAKFRNVTVSGTNMMITSSACRAMGGYANIPFSLTEDVGFVVASKARGFQTRNIWGVDTKAVIKPQADWGTLLKQRARWTYGALKLPILEVGLLSLRALYLPLVLLLAVWSPLLALVLFVLRIIIQSILVQPLANILGQRLALRTLLSFEVYYALVTLGGLLLYILPVKFSWKGRKYS